MAQIGRMQGGLGGWAYTLYNRARPPIGGSSSRWLLRPIRPLHMQHGEDHNGMVWVRALGAAFAGGSEYYYPASCEAS